MSIWTDGILEIESTGSVSVYKLIEQKLVFEVSRDNYIEIWDGIASSHNEFSNINEAINLIEKRNFDHFDKIYKDTISVEVLKNHKTVQDLRYVLNSWVNTIQEPNLDVRNAMVAIKNHIDKLELCLNATSNSCGVL